MLTKQKRWINHAIQLLEEKLVKDDFLSWSSFHASQLNNTEGLPALIALLPRQHHSVLTDAVVKQLDFHAQVSVNVVGQCEDN